MKRTLCGLAAFLMACCTFCACSEAPPPPPPPQSEFVQAVNEALKQEKTVRYICGLQESEVLCEEAQKGLDIMKQVESTVGKTEEEQTKIRKNNIACFAKYLAWTRKVQEGGYKKVITPRDSAKGLTPEEIAEKILQRENDTFTQIGWRQGDLPEVKNDGSWDGISGKDTYILVLSTQPILEGTMGEGGLTGTLPQGENTPKTNEPETGDLPVVPVQ